MQYLGRQRSRLERIYTYKNAMAMYGQELMNPMSQEFFSASGFGEPSFRVFESGIPKYCGKPKFAPLLPV